MALVIKMEQLFAEMQKENIAFILNDNEEVAVYNSKHIEDCEACGINVETPPEGYEAANKELLYPLFPIWAYENLFLKRKI